jgi:hypothetical protein
MEGQVAIRLVGVPSGMAAEVEKAVMLEGSRWDLDLEFMPHPPHLNP